MEHVDVKDRHDCPACAERMAEADRLSRYKTPKMFGRVTTNGRRYISRIRRQRDEILGSSWREHYAAIRAVKS